MTCFLNAVIAEPTFRSPNRELLLALKQIQDSNIQCSVIHRYFYVLALAHAIGYTKQHKPSKEQSSPGPIARTVFDPAET
jgi:hypothetical protein